jgi:hypothetical protein
MTSSLYYPDVECVRGRILGAMLRGDSLTQQDALKRFSNFRLAADIHELGKHGWLIDSEMIEVMTKDAGRKSQVKRYWIPTDAITAAGEFGIQYAESARQAEISRMAT